MNSKTRIAIIGAGMAGLGAAQRLVASGHSVCIFEKSRGLGGRCATRRWDGRIVDHGAQYFTIRDPEFANTTRAACGADLLQITAPILDDERKPLDGGARWYHVLGNNSLAKALKKKLGQHCEVRLEIPIQRADTLLRRNGGDFDRVICTAPWPQTKTLLGMPTEPTDATHAPCLTVALAYRGTWPGMTRETYAFMSRTSALAWCSCENHKLGRTPHGETLLIAQMSEEFSKEHLELDPGHYPDLVRSFVEACWKLDASDFLAAMGHRWRYSRTIHPPPAFSLPEDILVAGDSFTDSRIESAWLSGWEVAGRIVCADS